MAVYSDNSTALAYLRKQGGTLSSSLNAVAQELLRLCESQSVRLIPQFIPGGLIVLADSLSRHSQVLGSKWTFCPQAVRAPVSVASHHRPLSNVAEPSPAGVFLTDVRHAVRRHGCDVAVLGWSASLCLPSLQSSSSGVGKGSGFQGPEADIWPQHHWFPDLLEIPLFLPQRRDLLRQPHFHHFHQNLSVLQLTTYRISGDPHIMQASLTWWLVNLPTADAAPPASTTKPSG